LPAKMQKKRKRKKGIGLRKGGERWQARQNKFQLKAMKKKGVRPVTKESQRKTKRGIGAQTAGGTGGVQAETIPQEKKSSLGIGTSEWERRGEGDEPAASSMN